MKHAYRNNNQLIAHRILLAFVVLTVFAAEPYAHAQEYSHTERRAHTIERRAVEAIIWGMPAVNYRLMYDEMVRKTGGQFNQIVYWSGLLDWKNQTLTPNPDVIYAMPFFNTKDVGPIVLEIPPADDGVFNGSVMNCWQAAIEDIGPGGVDKGKGGKYLILPPNYPKDKIPDGYIPMSSDTYQGYALIRSVLKSGSDTDVAKAIAYTKRLKLYPLSQAANPPATIFCDAQGAVFDSRIQYDLRFFEALDTMIQEEPWLERDKAMIDPLKSLGIERGKPFNPDAETKTLLARAAKEARAWLSDAYESAPPFYKNSRWFFPASPEIPANVLSGFHTPDSYPTDNRGMIYSIAFFSAKHLGESQFYLLSTRDAAGNPFEGASNYCLHVPAGVPIKQYWSITVYNRDTHTFIENAFRLGRSSQNPGLQKNTDGSVDIYFGPKAPAGFETNWVPTDPKGRFELLARFYGPTQELYTKTGWILPDVEKLK